MLEKDFTSYKHYIFIGDPHGTDNINKMLHDIYKNNTIDNNTLIFICGDIGLGFVSEKTDMFNLTQCNDTLIKHNSYILLIRGNHDNPNLFTENSIFNMSNISVIEDYTIIHTYDKNILCIGGSISIDRTNRQEGKSYWKNEIITPLDDILKYEIDSLDYNIDIICAHSSPTYIKPVNNSMFEQGNLVSDWTTWDKNLLKDNWEDRHKLNDIYEYISKHHNISFWIYGHFHDHFESEYNNTQFIGLDMFYNTSKFIKSVNNGMYYKLGPDILDIHNLTKYNNINFSTY